jgi:hypothetical protein
MTDQGQDDGDGATIPRQDSRRDGTTESGKTESRRWLVGDADDDEQDVEQR